MRKHILFSKKLKKQFLSINDSIESSFDNLKLFIKNFKKTKFSENTRFLIVVGVTIVLILSYFSIPGFYNKDLIQSEIKNQILKKYNIYIKFDTDIGYGIFPKPHFNAKNLILLRDKNSEIDNNQIALVKDTKFFIEINNFFLKKNFNIKDIIFKKADFNIYGNDLLFFKKFLEMEPNQNRIVFKNTNIFFRNNADELLFISKLKNSEIFYDSKKLLNTIASSLEIFNVPFKLDIKNDKFNKSIFTEFNSKKLRLKVNNFINYSNQVRDALLELLFINKNIDIEYEIHNDYLKFNSEDEVKYNGVIEFKPFYLTSNFNYEGLSIKNIFDNNFIVIDLIKSGIFNNRNLNANINLKINNITNIDELNNLYLNFGIEEGIFKFSDSNIMWKDDLKISLLDSSLYSNENEIYILGRFILEFKNIDDFYKSFQVKKNYRKKIKEIQIDFNYNIDQQKIKFDNVKIDSNPNENLEKFVDDFNSSGNQIFNKIKFKNFVSKFFSVYAG